MRDRYGQWSRAFTENYGLWPHPSSLLPESGGGNDPRDRAYRACQAERAVEIGTFSHIETETDLTYVKKLIRYDAVAAERNKLWAKWGSCVDKHGLTRSEGGHATQEADALRDHRTFAAPSGYFLAEERRVASIEQQCNAEVQLAQQLADLDAQMEAPIVARYEAELRAERTRLDTKVTAARDYLAMHPSDLVKCSR